MTIETTVNKTIQSGNGSNKDFDFAFEIPDKDSLSLTKRGSDGTETAITTNFTVTGIGDEAGGSVNYPTSGSALASNEKIIIKRVISLKQSKNLRNQGDYSLEDIEDALDRAVMMCQQLQEQIDRSVVLNITSSQSGIKLDDLISNRLLVASSDGSKIEMSSIDYGSIDAYLSTLAAIADDISTVAGIAANVTTVAGIETEILAVDANEANINIVAGIDTEITTVAGIAANITSVAGNSTNINTVAGIAAAVTSVAAIAANVSTVAGIAANVTTVAGMSASIASVVANMTSIQNAASFNFPTLGGSDTGKFLKVNAYGNGYDLISGSTLTLLGDLTPAAGKIPYFTGASTADLFNLTGAIIPFAGSALQPGFLPCFGAEVSRTIYAALFHELVTVDGFSLQGFTVTIGSPAVFTKNGHGFLGGERVRLSTSGALPTGLLIGVDYFVKYVDANTFQLASTLDGPSINTTGSQSGTHSYLQSRYGLGDGSTTYNLPDFRNQFIRGYSSARSLGAGQLDSIQNITGTLGHIEYVINTVNGAFGLSGSLNGIRSASQGVASAITFDASRVVRTSTETRPVNIALNYCIKY